MRNDISKQHDVGRQPRQGGRQVRLAVAALLAIGCLIVVPAADRSAHAEETGISVTLSYVRDYSTWGPTNVYGSARVWPDEAVATLSVHDLPHLQGNNHYASWIVNTKSGDALALGSFNTSDAGDAYQDYIFNGPLPVGADAMVVTVLQSGEKLTFPGPLRSLAGYFTTLNNQHNTTLAHPITHHTSHPTTKKNRAAHTSRPATRLSTRPVIKSSTIHPTKPGTRHVTKPVSTHVTKPAARSSTRPVSRPLRKPSHTLAKAHPGRSRTQGKVTTLPRTGRFAGGSSRKPHRRPRVVELPRTGRFAGPPHPPHTFPILRDA